MKPQVHYATVTEATKKLKEEGFTGNFSIKEGKLVTAKGSFPLENFEIIETYRYEGDSDPGDEATVYALQSRSGDVKGILITTYNSESTIPFEALAKMNDKSKDNIR